MTNWNEMTNYHVVKEYTIATILPKQLKTALCKAFFNFFYFMCTFLVFYEKHACRGEHNACWT